MHWSNSILATPKALQSLSESAAWRAEVPILNGFARDQHYRAMRIFDTLREFHAIFTL